MNYSFEYIDIILLAMIAGFIFLRLRGILGKKTGFEGKLPSQFEKEFQKFNIKPKPVSDNFDEEAQKNFLKGAKIAYETIITDFSDSDNRLIASKPLINKKIHDQFNQSLIDRKEKGHFAEITFIGIKSAKIKTHKKIDNNLEVTIYTKENYCFKPYIYGNQILEEKAKKISDYHYEVKFDRENITHWYRISFELI